MRALTVRQPWASLIVAGIKDVENRTWPIPSTVTRVCLGSHDRPQRGDDFPADDPEPCRCGPAPFALAIHAGAKRDRADRAAHAAVLAGEQVPGGHLLALDAQSFGVLGVLLGYVTVTGCHHADDCRVSWPPYTRQMGPCSLWAEPNAYHWTLADPQPLDEPIPYKGRQGLWTVPDGVLAGVPA